MRGTGRHGRDPQGSSRGLKDVSRTLKVIGGEEGLVSYTICYIINYMLFLPRIMQNVTLSFYRLQTPYSIRNLSIADILTAFYYIFLNPFFKKAHQQQIGSKIEYGMGDGNTTLL